MVSIAPESMGFKLTEGNTVTINLEPDTVAETDKLFAALAAGGSVDMHRRQDKKQMKDS